MAVWPYMGVLSSAWCPGGRTTAKPFWRDRSLLATVALITTQCFLCLFCVFFFFFSGCEVKINQRSCILFFFLKKPDKCDHSYLQLSGSHFENELHHGADSETSCTGGVDLVPNGVTVHLETQNTFLQINLQYRSQRR